MIRSWHWAWAGEQGLLGMCSCTHTHTHTQICGGHGVWVRACSVGDGCVVAVGGQATAKVGAACHCS